MLCKATLTHNYAQEALVGSGITHARKHARAHARTRRHLIEAARVLTFTGLLSAPFIPALTHSVTSAVLPAKSQPKTTAKACASVWDRRYGATAAKSREQRTVAWAEGTV